MLLLVAYAAAAPGWLKGQLHAHTNGSGDSDTPAADVARWYAEHGYDFVVLTDHQVVTAPPANAPLLVIPGVELTQNLRSCVPAPEAGLSCLLHVNALDVRAPAGPVTMSPVTDTHRYTILATSIALAEKMGGLAQLNHPNFHYAADAPLIASLAKGRTLLMEIANEAVDSNNAGDATHPSTEALWDAALAMGARIWGTATDDAHHYYDAATVKGQAFVGDRGFVMVYAERNAASIHAALEAGDFYASNGALIDGVDGTVRPRDPAAKVQAVPVAGRVRYVVTDSRGRKAWTQPITASAPAPAPRAPPP